MSEKNITVSPKKAIELTKVKIALVLCGIELIALLLPFLRFSDAAIMYFRNIEHQTYTLFSMGELDPIFMYSAIILLVCFAGTALLFFTDHPKLALLPTIIALSLLLLLVYTCFIQYRNYDSEDVSMTVWPMIQIVCDIALIIFAFKTPKAHHKLRKIKANDKKTILI